MWNLRLKSTTATGNARLGIGARKLISACLGITHSHSLVRIARWTPFAYSLPPRKYWLIARYYSSILRKVFVSGTAQLFTQIYKYPTSNYLLVGTFLLASLRQEEHCTYIGITQKIIYVAWVISIEAKIVSFESQNRVISFEDMDDGGPVIQRKLSVLQCPFISDVQFSGMFANMPKLFRFI